MSIASALSNALSGLNAATRSTELISNNVANALTPGYARRTLELASASVAGVGAGVQIAGVRMAEDPVLTAERRRIDASVGDAETRFAALDRIAQAIGEPGEDQALASRAAAFENALLAAANDPSSTSRQLNVVDAGRELAGSLNDIAMEYRTIRTDSETDIARQVDTVNTTLERIAELNREIQVRGTGTGDASGLIDERRRLVDQISSIIPLRTAMRDGNQIALFSRNGAVLLDGGRPAELGFTKATIVTQEMTVGGMLSGLTLNDRSIDIGTGSGQGLLDGGSLSALFYRRDVSVPAAYDQLDAFAADLVSRFQDPAVDPTLTAGDAGFFTDGGSAYLAANQSGLASRLAVNAAVDPRAGGAEWRVRDGINAATPGESDSSAILTALLDVARDPRSAPAAFGITATGSIAELAEVLTSHVATEARSAETRAATVRGYQDSLEASESAVIGVDTDREMQQLILAEQAYAANARVITVVDSMVRRLLEI